MDIIHNKEYDSEENEEVASTKVSKVSRCSRIVDSEDDDSSAINKTAEDETEDNQVLNEKMDVNDSSSSEDELKSNLKKKSLIKKRHLSDSESDDDNKKASNDNCSDDAVDVWGIVKPNKLNENNIDEPDAAIKTKFLDSDIYDAEGSSDEGQVKISDHEVEENFDLSKKKKKEKKDKAKRNNLQRKSKQTAIEEIRSETQRLVRQSRISLPYHRPKQRSLSEFLDRRKSLPVVPLKTSTDELSKVWEKIEEREKTAESFYKSESDASDGESSSVPLVKVTEDNNNKSTENDNVMQESSMELCLHYTETESQEIKNDSEVKEDQINHETNGIEMTDTEKTSENELVINVETESTVCDVSSTNKINISETDNVLTSSVEENIEHNLTILNEGSEALVKDDSEQSYSADVLKNLETENNSETSMALKNDEKYLNRSNRLKPDVMLNKVPKLSGQPDEVIDFEKSPEKPGAVKLISRFMKHITLKPKVKIQENVVVAISEVNEHGEIVNIKEETLEMKRKEESLKLKVGDTSKPGETRMKLQATLRNKIAQCREQQFAKRLEEYKINEEEVFGENEKPDYEEEVEEELTESESESEIEDDVEIKDDVKEKNPFVDEEAEESENDEEGIDNHDGSDADEYSDAPSVDLASLVDKDEEHLPIEIDMVCGSQRNNELMALCSGGFTSQPINLNDLEENDLAFTQLDANTKNSETSPSPSKISREPTLPLNDICKTVDEAFASDEDESDEEISIKKKKKCKLTFSDDEDDVDGDYNEVSDDDDNEVDVDVDDSDDEIDDVGNPNESENSDEDLENVVFDENEEIVVSAEYEQHAVELVEDVYSEATLKAAKRFLEAEAELSGSEWGSADEDELDLDAMEKEEGDEDVINQRKVRSELEKIHMKELLDEDKREIRALQELFLEDGELHSDGPKRQRQFRWYNQDGENENGSFLTNLDGDFKDNGEEDEEDESWRKTRLERENFLRNQKNDETEIPDENVKFLKFAKKTVMKPSPNPPQAKFASPDPRKQFSLVSTRGSFLSRGEKTLSKLAELTNVSSDNPLGNVRGQRNMVFAVVSPPKEEPKEMPLKRKSTSNLPASTAKKLKFSPPRNQRPGGSLFEKLKMVD